MSRYIPYPAYYDEMPVDISFVFRNDVPAGKHGFMKVDGSHFAFEDGSPARFWGVNFNGGACFPPFDYSEKVAQRLAQAGCNIVRFHQLDAEWDSPNIFTFNKGERIGSTLELNPRSMKRLDYLIKCLKDNGIYVYLDMVTYRNFKAADGVENALALTDGSTYCYFSDKLIELQKKFIYDIFNHVNPYTGLAYKDDPVIVMSEIINERDLFTKNRLKRDEPYFTEFITKYADWAKENGRAIDFDALKDWDSAQLEDDENDDLTDFKVYQQNKYYNELFEYMKSVGVKYPICGTNWYRNGAVVKSNQVCCEYVDSHMYFYDWKWGEVTKCCMNTPVTKVPTFSMEAISKTRCLDKPLFISEWDMPWPNEYRAESSILWAAIGALNGWSGFAIHTYAYGTRLADMKILGKEVSSSTIGGVPYREGIFSVWNDPAKFGLFYHAALITRRGDVKESPLTIASVCKKGLAGSKYSDMPGLNGADEYAKVGTTFEDCLCKADKYFDEDQPIVDLSKGEITSVTGEMYRNWNKNYGTIDTEMTKVAYGFLGKNGAVAVKGMTVKAETDFGVVALSSLTDEPISKSTNMLLSTIGRAKNTNSRFEGNQMYEWGEAPITVEVIEAELTIETERTDLICWAVNAEGMFTGKAPARFEDGKMIITLGKTIPSPYYLIQAE